MTDRVIQRSHLVISGTVLLGIAGISFKIKPLLVILQPWLASPHGVVWFRAVFDHTVQASQSAGLCLPARWWCTWWLCCCVAYKSAVFYSMDSCVLSVENGDFFCIHLLLVFNCLPLFLFVCLLIRQCRGVIYCHFYFCTGLNCRKIVRLQSM